MRCPNPAKTVAENEIASTIDCLDNQSNQNARRCLRLDNRLPRQSIKPKRKALPKGIPINSTPKPFLTTTAVLRRSPHNTLQRVTAAYHCLGSRAGVIFIYVSKVALEPIGDAAGAS